MNSALKNGLRDLAKARYEHVHATAIKMIRSDLADPVPYFLLARIASAHHNRNKALELHEKSMALSSNDPFYVAEYAQYLVAIGHQSKAIELAESVFPEHTKDAFTSDTLGVVYSRTGFHEHAVPYFKRAVQLDPNPANFHYNLGASLQFSGDFGGARMAYQAALQRDPESFRAYSSLVGLSKQTVDDNHVAQLSALFSQHLGTPDAALHLGHAIAKSLEDMERHEESFDWLVRAKRLKRESLDYNLAEDLELFAASKTCAPVHTPILQSNVESVDPSPIFIVGLPRTGTTLVDRILSSHPEVTSAGELNTFAGAIKTASGSSTNRVLDVDTLTRMNRADLSAVGRNYISQTRKLNRGTPRFTDKMPLNFFYVGLIHQALPNARIVVLRRDAVDSCLSNFRQLFSTGFSYYNYSLDIEDTGHYYKAFDGLMRHWRSTVPADRLLEVGYEDIVFDQEVTTQRLLKFCDLDWHDGCLQFHKNDAPVSTASSVQVRQPLYSGSIGRWKKYASRLNGLLKVLERND